VPKALAAEEYLAGIERELLRMFTRSDL